MPEGGCPLVTLVRHSVRKSRLPKEPVFGLFTGASCGEMLASLLAQLFEQVEEIPGVDVDTAGGREPHHRDGSHSLGGKTYKIKSTGP